MTILWLFVWLVSDTPAVTFSPKVNDWAVCLIIAIVIDLATKNSSSVW